MKNQTKIKKVDANKFVDKVKEKDGVYRPEFKIAIAIICSFLGLYAILLVISAFYDFQIDEILAKWLLPTLSNTSVDLNLGAATGQLGQVYTNGPIGRLVETIGTSPCIIITVAACGIFYHNASYMKNARLAKFTKCSMWVLSVGWMIYACFFQFFPLFIISIVGVQNYAAFGPLGTSDASRFTMAMYLVFGCFVGIGCTWAAFKALGRVQSQTMKELLRWAFIASTASLASILVVEIAIKPVVQRERFRFIYALSQVTQLTLKDGTVYTDPTQIQNYFNDINVYGGFHPWWGLVVSPNAFKAGNLPFISEDITKSFPSGHATMAAVGFYSLWVLPLTVKAFNTKKARAWCFWLGICGTAFVGLFRLMAGAHYLSDVLFGSLFAIFFLILSYLMNTRGNNWLNKYTGISFEKSARAVLA